MGWRPRAAVGQSVWGEPGAAGGVRGACCRGARRAGAREEAGLQPQGPLLSRERLEGPWGAQGVEGEEAVRGAGWGLL